MQNRTLIYSKPNIGDGPPELRTISTFTFCIAWVHIWTRSFKFEFNHQFIPIERQWLVNKLTYHFWEKMLVETNVLPQRILRCRREREREASEWRRRCVSVTFSKSFHKKLPGCTPPSYTMLPQTISIDMLNILLKKTVEKMLPQMWQSYKKQQ